MTLPQIDPARIAALATELRDVLGPAAVSDESAVLDRVSVDGSTMSPVVKDQLPLGRAQLVVWPAGADQIAVAVAAAVRHGVPVTPRGKGTGNYGQAIPMAGGVVVDTSKARTIVEITDGLVTADAGATLIALERAVNDTGQQLLMYPSTVQSTVGGFLSGGSGGTGSIAHGMLHTGYVAALDVVHADGTPALVHLEGAATEPYLHTYGTAGIIARATLHLEPRQDWQAFYASFNDFHDAYPLVRELSRLNPAPRLVSADLPAIAAALPADPAVPAGRASLRAILDPATVEAATTLVTNAGGKVEDVRSGLQQTVRLSTISYNHPIEWLMRSTPGQRWFHIEVSGDNLIDRVDDVHRVYPGAILHLEGQRSRPIGMLAAPYTGPEDVWAGFDRLTALDVGFHNPHQWYVDHRPDRTRALAVRTDPDGLLNPGKLVTPTVVTGTGSQVAS